MLDDKSNLDIANDLEYLKSSQENDPADIRKFKEAFKTASSVLLPIDSRSVGDFLCENMKVSQGAESLPFDGKAVFYMMEPLECLRKRRYQEVIFMGPARTGKTLALITGYALWVTAIARQDCYIIHMSENKANEYKKSELDPTLNKTYSFNSAVSPSQNSRTLQLIRFKYGNKLLIKWPSKNNLAGTTTRNMLITDYDRWPDNIDGEGDGYNLAKTRTVTYGLSAKVVVESSPGKVVLELDKPLKGHYTYQATGIASLYNKGDKRRYYFKCLGCKEYFLADFNTVYYDNELPTIKEKAESARVRCPNCGHLHTTKERNSKLIPNGVWLRHGETINADGVIDSTFAEDSTTASFWLTAPAQAFLSLESLVTGYLEAYQHFKTTGDQTKLQTFFNTSVGTPYKPINLEEDVAVSDWDELTSDNHFIGEAPYNTRALIASCDVQAGNKARFVVQVFAVTDLNSIYLVDRFELRKTKDGDDLRPDQVASDWDILIPTVFNYYAKVKNTNKSIGVSYVLCDSGGFGSTTQNAYAFNERLKLNGLYKRFYLVKGDRPRGASGELKRVNLSTSKDTPKNLLIINVNHFKDVLYNKFKAGDRLLEYIRFPKNTPREVFEELEAEKKTDRGYYVKKQNHLDNEAIDLFCYFLAFCDFMDIRTKIKNPNLFRWLAPVEAGNSFSVDSSILKDQKLLNMLSTTKTKERLKIKERQRSSRPIFRKTADF